MAEVASLEAHNAALVAALLQAQQQNQVVLGPLFLDPFIGGVQDATI